VSSLQTILVHQLRTLSLQVAQVRHQKQGGQPATPKNRVKGISFLFWLDETNTSWSLSLTLGPYLINI